MQTDRFIAHIYNACPQLDPDAIHEASLIVIDSLSEQLPAEQARRMASQLPDEIADAVANGAERSDASARPISLASFYDKVGFRTELEGKDLEALTKATVQTLNQVLSDGEQADVALELPAELDRLLNEAA